MGIGKSKNYSLRRVVEKQAFYYLAGQHEMSIMCQKPLPPHVCVRHIGVLQTYCLYRPPVHPTTMLPSETLVTPSRRNHTESTFHTYGIPPASSSSSSASTSPLYVGLRRETQPPQGQEQYHTPQCIILCFHGNAESVYGLWDGVIKYMAALLPGCAFIAVEYPGYVCEELTPRDKYWDSESPTEDDIKQHALSVFDRCQQKWPHVPVVCMGRSLGCGVSLWLSTVRNVRGLLLLAPYLSIMRVGVGWSLPFADIFDSTLIAHKCRAQNVVIVHSEDDPVIPIQHSEVLARQMTHCSYIKLLRRSKDGHEARYMKNARYVRKLMYHLGMSDWCVPPV